jgi:hypothetical protein
MRIPRDLLITAAFLPYNQRCSEQHVWQCAGELVMREAVSSMGQHVDSVSVRFHIPVLKAEVSAAHDVRRLAAPRAHWTTRTVLS